MTVRGSSLIMGGAGKRRLTCRLQLEALVAYNQRSFALKHHRGTRLFFYAVPRRIPLVRKRVGRQVRSSSPYPRFHIQKPVIRPPRWVFVDAFATVNGSYRIRATGWRVYTFLLPTVSGYYRQREGESVIEREREKGGCNYIAGGCGLIARTLGLPNWSIKKKTRCDQVGTGSVLDIRPSSSPRKSAFFIDRR